MGDIDGADLGILIIRLALGTMLLAHGLNKAFGPGGLAGTEGWFEALGLRPAALHARVACFAEIVAGVLLAVGFLNPLAAAMFVGLMTVATRTDHRGKGYFVFKGGWEYTVLVAFVSIGLATTGPGRFSVDALWGLPVSGLAWGSAQRPSACCPLLHCLRSAFSQIHGRAS